jgi:hypothetical protein
MRIINKYLVRLPIYDELSDTRIYKVFELDTGEFYRESWKGMLIMRLSIKELFYEKMKNYSYTFDYILLVYLCQIIKKNVYMSKKLVKPITPEDNG